MAPKYSKKYRMNRTFRRHFSFSESIRVQKYRAPHRRTIPISGYFRAAAPQRMTMDRRKIPSKYIAGKEYFIEKR